MHISTDVIQNKINHLLSSFNKKNYREAKKIAKKLLNIDNNNIDALNILCRISLINGELSQAESHIKQALKHKPGSTELIRTQATVYMYKLEFEKAADIFQSIVLAEPNSHAERRCLADCYLELEQFAKAIPHYNQLIFSGIQFPFVSGNLFCCLLNTLPKRYSVEQENNCIAYLSFDDSHQVDVNDIAKYVSTLIKLKYELGENEKSIELVDIANDQLLKKSLTKINLCDPFTELFLTGVRRSLLIELLNTANIAKESIELAVSIASQQHFNEYTYLAIEDEETAINNIIETLKTSIDYSNLDKDNLTGAIILIAMYRPLYQIEFLRPLVETNLPEWPEIIQPLLKQCLFEIHAEQLIAPTIINLTEINNETSKAVKQQYEVNPYPRWKTISYSKTSGYADSLVKRLFNYSPPEHLKAKHPEVLIAGCGTGKHAIELSTWCPETKILAIDLSSRSLAYAKLKAQEYQLKNIDFKLADIMQLGNLDRQFNIIESVGVLHHMQDPDLGFQSLTSLLLPQGIMKIGLYSELARQPIVKARKIIQEQNIPSTPQGIRQFRLAAMDGQYGEEIKNLACHSPDFYSLSGCRDLFFHCQEHRYTCEKIQQTLNKFNLQFLGFSYLSPNSAAIYRSRFGDDPAMRSLENWSLIEQENPSMFARMYQFWCQLK